MAGARRFERNVRRVRRWAHTTRGALDASALAGSIVLAGLVFGLVAALTDIGIWGVAIAALPLANQIRVQVEMGQRRRRGSGPDLPPALSSALSSSSSLAGADLAGVDLSSRDLRHRRLTDADLTDADLTGTDLVASDLSRATIVGARLGKADLSYGSLDGADLTRASLYGAILIEAALRRVDGRNANFERTDLRNASFDGANLLGARFRGADVRGADFTGAKLAADALADATLDATTVLADGSSGDPIEDSAAVQIRSTMAVALSGLALAMARPALQGLLVAGLGTGTVMAAQSSGGGLGHELAIVTAADRDLDDLVPRAKPRLPATGAANSSTDGAVGDVAIGRENSTPVELGELIAPAGIGDEDRDSTSGGGAETGGVPRPGADDTGAEPDADPGPTEEATPSPPGGVDAAPETSAAQTVGDGSPGDEGSTTTGPDRSGQPDPSDRGAEPGAQEDDESAEPSDEPTDGSAGLTEVEPVVPPGQAVVRRIRIVVGSEGGEATVTAASSLGQLEPRTIDGPDGWELGLASGEIRVEVAPSTEAVSTACQIQVDGTERSFQSSLVGRTAICIVDLDPPSG